MAFEENKKRDKKRYLGGGGGRARGVGGRPAKGGRNESNGERYLRFSSSWLLVLYFYFVLEPWYCASVFFLLNVILHLFFVETGWDCTLILLLLA